MYWCPLFEQNSEDEWLYAEIVCIPSEGSKAFINQSFVGKFDSASEAAKALNKKDPKVPSDVKVAPWSKRPIFEIEELQR